jgi:hypothetical protein
LPDISIKDDLDLDIEVEPGEASAITKYFKSPAQFFNKDGKLAKQTALSLADPAFTSFHTDLNTAHPLPVVAEDISLTLKAGVSATIDVFVPDPHLEPKETDSLFSPDNYGEDVPVKQTERYVSVGLIATVGSAASTAVSDVHFGFNADSFITLVNYQKFSIAPVAPTFLAAIKTTFASFQLPASVADLRAMLPDSVITVAGTGSLKFTASANLLALSNPLATAELPAGIGSIAVSEGASVRVGASFRFFGDYEIRVRKTSATAVRLGYFKEHGKEWKATVSASTGVSLSLGGDDLFAQIISALSPDAEADFRELKQASVDATTIATIQATVKAAIDRTLEVATSYEIASLTASQAAFLYEIDLSALDQDGETAVRTALRGDLTPFLNQDEESLPRGIKMVQSVFTNLRQAKHTFKVNLLGIYNFISISKLVLKGKALYHPETGELILSDTATATTLEAGVVNIGGRPNQADPKQVRKILASSFLITAAYRASQAVLTPPTLKSSHTYCEVHEQTSQEIMADELGVAVALGLIGRAESSELIQGTPQFGRTVAYATAAYNDSLATAFFLQGESPRAETEYEDIGRQAMQLVAARNGAADPVRLRPLQNDDLWKEMKEGGQSKFKAVLPDATALQIGAVTADYSTIVWWAKTMKETGQALMNVKNFLVKNPGVDPKNADFQKLRSDLAQHLKNVAAESKEEFGRPWGLIAMDLLTGRRSEARVTFTGPVINLTRARPVAASAAGGRQMI